MNTHWSQKAGEYENFFQNLLIDINCRQAFDATLNEKYWFDVMNSRTLQTETMKMHHHQINHKRFMTMRDLGRRENTLKTFNILLQLIILGGINI